MAEEPEEEQEEEQEEDEEDEDEDENVDEDAYGSEEYYEDEAEPMRREMRHRRSQDAVGSASDSGEEEEGETTARLGGRSPPSSQRPTC